MVQMLPTAVPEPEALRPRAEPPRPQAGHRPTARPLFSSAPRRDVAAEALPPAEALPVQQPTPIPAVPATAPARGVEAPPTPAITPARFDAAYLQNPAPIYPPLSRRLGEEGKVLLRVFVEPGGTAGQVEIKASSGSPRLDQAAMDAVRRWQFVPARRGDEAVGAWVLVPILFNLRG